MEKSGNIAGHMTVDLGKVRKKRVKQLKRGRGKLSRKVQNAAEHARNQLGPQAKDAHIVPVVIIYRKKDKKRRRKARKRIKRWMRPLKF